MRDMYARLCRVPLSQHGATIVSVDGQMRHSAFECLNMACADKSSQAIRNFLVLECCISQLYIVLRSRWKLVSEVEGQFGDR